MVRSLFSNLEHMIPDGNDTNSTLLEDCYKINTKDCSWRTPQDLKCKKILKNESWREKGNYDCVMKIYDKKNLKFNNMRKVSVSTDAYYSFVANDIEGVQKLVDYLEDDDNVYLVYQNTPDKSQNLKTFIAKKYAKKILVDGKKVPYENVSIEVFRKITITLLELFNHGIVNKSLTPENIAIDSSFKPLLINFKFSNIPENEHKKEWESLMNQIGLLLFELWMGHSLEDVKDLQFFLSSNEDIAIPDPISEFLQKTLNGSIKHTDFYKLFDKFFDKI